MKELLPEHAEVRGVKYYQTILTSSNMKNACSAHSDGDFITQGRWAAEGKTRQGRRLSAAWGGMKN